MKCLPTNLPTYLTTYLPTYLNDDGCLREHNNTHKHHQIIQETQTQSILLFYLLVLN